MGNLEGTIYGLIIIAAIVGWAVIEFVLWLLGHIDISWI